MTVECVLTTAAAPTRTLEALLEASYRLSRTTTTAQAANVVAEAARELRYADGVHLYLSEQLGSSVWSNANQSPGSADRGTLSFDFATQARNTKKLSVPTLSAWAEDDTFIERAVFEEHAAKLPAGPRLTFPRGGHNVQKSHAVELAAGLISILHT